MISNLLLNRTSNNNTFVNYESEEITQETETICGAAFIEAYNTVPQTITTGGNVFFPVVSLQENLDTNSATGEFTIKTDGFYYLAIGIVAAGTDVTVPPTPSIAQFSIFVNGVFKPSSPFVAVEGALFRLKAGDIITVKPTAASSTVVTNVNAGKNPSVTAKIVIFKI